MRGRHTTGARAHGRWAIRTPGTSQWAVRTVTIGPPGAWASARGRHATEVRASGRCAARTPETSRWAVRGTGVRVPGHPRGVARGRWGGGYAASAPVGRALAPSPRQVRGSGVRSLAVSRRSAPAAISPTPVPFRDGSIDPQDSRYTRQAPVTQCLAHDRWMARTPATWPPANRRRTARGPCVGRDAPSGPPADQVPASRSAKGRGGRHGTATVRGRERARQRTREWHEARQPARDRRGAPRVARRRQGKQRSTRDGPEARRHGQGHQPAPAADQPPAPALKDRAAPTAHAPQEPAPTPQGPTPSPPGTRGGPPAPPTPPTPPGQAPRFDIQASTSSERRGRERERFSLPDSVTRMSSSMRTPMPRYSSGTVRSSAWK